MRIAVLEIPQQGDERNDFSVLSDFDWKLIPSDCAVSFGFSRRCLFFLTPCSGFLPVYRRTCLSHARALCLGPSRGASGATPRPWCRSLRDCPMTRGQFPVLFSPLIPGSRLGQGLRMGRGMGKSPPILAEARQLIVLVASLAVHLTQARCIFVVRACAGLSVNAVELPWIIIACGGSGIVWGNEYDEVRPSCPVGLSSSRYRPGSARWQSVQSGQDGASCRRLGAARQDPRLAATRSDRLQFSWERVGDVFSCFGSSNLQGAST